MTEVSISNGMVTVDVLGWHKLWCFKGHLQFPLAHITGIQTVTSGRPGGIRAPGTYIPWVITAGTYHQIGRKPWKKVFWDVHDPRKAIAIDLHNDPFSAIIIEVADPAETILKIQEAARVDRFARKTYPCKL